LNVVVEAATGWLLFTGLVLTVGASAARWLLVPRVFAPGGDRDRMVVAAGRMGLAGAAVLPVAMALVFHRQMKEFRDPFATWSEDATLLLRDTDWGATFLLAAGAAVATLVVWGFIARGRAWAWFAAPPLAAGLSTYPALSGHASGTGALTALTVPADAAHVLAAGVWVGGLAFVLYADACSRRHRGGSELPRLVPAYSPLAVLSVGVLLLTGAVASWAQLEGLAALTGTAYGRLLLGKLGIVAAVMGLGLRNWKRLTPLLATPEGPAALRRSASLELLLAQVVLLVTAVLVRTSPLGH
jgi:putative copper export protein